MTKHGSEGLGDLLSVFFGTGEVGPREQATQPGLAERCLRVARAALAAGSDSQPGISETLATADLTLAVADGEVRMTDGSIAVLGEDVATVRGAAPTLKHELAAALKHEGWQLRSLQVVAQDPGEQVPASPPKRAEMVEAVTEAVAWKKAYEVPAYCDRLELPSHPDPESDPWQSKRVYVRGRLEPLDISAIVDVAAAVLEDLDDERLGACPRNRGMSLVAGSCSTRLSPLS